MFNPKVMLIMLIVGAILGAGPVLNALGLINKADAQVLRENLGSIDTVSVETYPETGIEIKNGTAGGVFVVPPANAYTEITDWETVTDTKGLYKFTCAKDVISVAAGTVGDISNATGKVNGSADSFTSLGTTKFEVANLSHKYTGIAPIFDSNNTESLLEVYLSLFSLRGTILETFVTDGDTTIQTSTGSITLKSGITLETLTKTIFGTANEKKTLATGENWGIMRLSSASTYKMDAAVDSKISSKFNKYKIYLATVSNQPTVKNVLAQALIADGIQYSSLNAGQKEIVDVLADGILNYGTGDIIAIPVKDGALTKSNNVAVFCSKNPINREQ